MKTSGIDKLQRQISDFQKALATLEGDLGAVCFDADDPASIDNAIKEAERMVDQKLGSYISNPFVSPVITATKESVRQMILDRAAEERLKND